MTVFLSVRLLFTTGIGVVFKLFSLNIYFPFWFILLSAILTFTACSTSWCRLAFSFHGLTKNPGKKLSNISEILSDRNVLSLRTGIFDTFIISFELC